MNHKDPSEAVERKQAVAGVFHRASSIYDHVGPGFFSYFGRKLVEHAELPLHARVLDVATGRGAVLFPAVEAVGPNGFVIGIDFAEGMAKETARALMQRGIKNAEVHQMDAEDLNFPDASFDAILCGFAIFFFPQVERALAEFRRTLNPGGRMALTTWGALFNKEWEWFDTLIGRYVSPKPKEDKTPDSSAGPDFETSEGMEQIMKAAGFEKIQVISDIADFTYSTGEEWWESLWSHGARAVLERIEKFSGSEGLSKFRVECLQHIDAKKGSQGFQQSFHVLYTLAVNPV